VDKAARKATDMKRLWALGNWSRFVRPGYVRMEVESPDDALLVSAWAAPDGKETVLVVVNEGREAVASDISGLADMSGLSAGPVMTCWETSEAFSLEKVSEGIAGACSFPARSITTLVIR
jgi:hypothetical protein